jgi:hypothetical protein
MNVQEIFQAMLASPLLKEKYELKAEDIEYIKLHEKTGQPIIEVIQLVLTSLENNTPTNSINSQVKTYFDI